jgi:hypothetical protein
VKNGVKRNFNARRSPSHANDPKRCPLAIQKPQPDPKTGIPDQSIPVRAQQTQVESIGPVLSVELDGDGPEDDDLEGKDLNGGKPAKLENESSGSSG